MLFHRAMFNDNMRKIIAKEHFVHLRGRRAPELQKFRGLIEDQTEELFEAMMTFIYAARDDNSLYRKPGYVYFLSSVERPGFLKIGFSNNPYRRAKALTSEYRLAHPFRVERYFPVLHPRHVETAIHRRLRHVRPDWKELFKVSLEEATTELKKLIGDVPVYEREEEMMRSIQ